ncbi:DUF2071 domain-containing protein [Sulfidibacter corallicola]|uniref:DUF2071 domain-containing protein n=1 Tax=Sulfidibacter corallicola TaxID=2818388 RepID=A0A8A4THH9_SULCO|nr:DUF2071 domain-containing protein [Sulfidibacter corallicola]QTD48947.1 DUF2071 domain-containing protein [Sulfidibacter corallicola]
MTHPSLNHTDHRPWPMPTTEWRWRQTWCDLLFMHYHFDPEQIRPLIPPGLTLDTFSGHAWVGIVPFRMEDVMWRGLPGMPGVSNFPELNLRTYVTFGDKPGVWFFSLDASQAMAVWAARKFFHLPYRHAFMAVTRSDDADIGYFSRRKDDSRQIGFRAGYGPCFDPLEAPPGGLTHWLTERYCLYAQSKRGQVYRAEVHHARWPLKKAWVEVEENTVLRTIDLATPTDQQPHLAFARRLEVVVCPPHPVH